MRMVHPVSVPLKPLPKTVTGVPTGPVVGFKAITGAAKTCVTGPSADKAASDIIKISTVMNTRFLFILY
jgi:hypothetical protein